MRVYFEEERKASDANCDDGSRPLAADGVLDLFQFRIDLFFVFNCCGYDSDGDGNKGNKIKTVAE